MVYFNIGKNFRNDDTKFGNNKYILCIYRYMYLCVEYHITYENYMAN